jgi:hypothetical protein
MPPAAIASTASPSAMASAPAIHRGMLAPGRRGTAETVAVMADLATGRWGAQSAAMRDLALRIVTDAGIDAKDARGEVDAIHAWVQQAIRYTRDPIGQERVQTPEHTAFVARSGDCDDFAVLEAALLGALGHRTRFVTVGFTPSYFSHVYTEVEVRGTWLPLDAIVDHPPGWEVADAALRTTWPVNQPGGFDPIAAARARGVLDGCNGVLAGLGTWYDPRTWFGAEPEPPPSLYGPLPDPAWIYANHGDAGADALRTGSTQPGWDAATPAQRSGYITALRAVFRQQGDAIDRTTAALDTADRVARGVATLGTSEIVRLWDDAVAKARQYGRVRSQALGRAAILAAAQPAAAARLRQAVADGDARVLDAMGPLRPFLAGEAGLGIVPAVAYALGAAAIAAVVVALGWAISQVGAALRDAGSAVADAGTGIATAAPVLLGVVGVVALWLWLRHRAGPRSRSVTTARGRDGGQSLASSPTARRAAHVGNPFR